MTRIGSLFLIVFTALANSTFAATITVTNLDDSGPGSLRQALLDGQTGDSIRFDPALNGRTITVATPLLMESSMSLSALDLPDGITLSGGGATLILLLDIQDFDNITRIEGLTFTQGSGVSGGALLTFMSYTVIDQCNFINNSAQDNGGAFANVDSFTAITNSVFSNNTAPSGGAISSNAFLFIANSTIVGNQSTGIDPGVLSSTTSPLSLYIKNSTLVGNSGGVYASDLDGQLPAFENTIVTGNNGADVDIGPSSFAIFGSAGYNLFGTVDTQTVINLATTDQTNIDPLTLFVDVDGNNIIDAADLQNLGGRTRVLAPLPGSISVDAGNPNFDPTDIVNQIQTLPPDQILVLPPFIQSLTEGDQRGTGFPRITNDIIDIGAVEFGSGNGGIIPPVAVPALNKTGIAMFIIVVLAQGLFLRRRYQACTFRHRQ